MLTFENFRDLKEGFGFLLETVAELGSCEELFGETILDQVPKKVPGPQAEHMKIKINKIGGA